MTRERHEQPDGLAQDEQTPLRLLKKIGSALAGFLIGVVSVQKPIDMLLDGRDTRVRKELEDQSTRSREWQ
ncbi:MAG TPA: hypothetical protein VFU32_07960 [Ktedonobacterales bacterium]|nr:hypothetical protein [Ktedonobacterales bacterium]